MVSMMLSPTRLRRFHALGIDPARDQDMADGAAETAKQ